jgi:hypothetical protein
MRKKVLATSWHPGGANAIVPVIKRLSNEKRVDVVSIGHQYSENIFESSGIPYKKIADFGLKDVSPASMEVLIQAESPELVLTGTSAQDENNKEVIEQTATLAAKKQNVLTLSVLDFWGNYSLRFNDIYTGEKFKFLPDKIAIMDKYAEKAMIDEGFENQKLIITGNPHFDNLESKAKRFTDADDKKLRQQIGMSQEILIFYAANTWKKDAPISGYWDLDNIRIINHAFNELPKQQQNKAGLIIKLHPRTPEEDVREIANYISENSSNNIRQVTDIGAQELVLASDLTLTSNSTVGIEAVYMGKPCISIQPRLKTADGLSILTKNKIIPVGYTVQECKNLIRKSILDPKYRQEELMKKASSFRTDGKATERVTNIVYEMLRL